MPLLPDAYRLRLALTAHPYIHALDIPFAWQPPQYNWHSFSPSLPLVNTDSGEASPEFHHLLSRYKSDYPLFSLCSSNPQTPGYPLRTRSHKAAWCLRVPILQVS